MWPEREIARRAGRGGARGREGGAIVARAATRDAPGSSVPSLQSQYSSFTLDLWITVVPPSHREIVAEVGCALGGIDAAEGSARRIVDASRAAGGDEAEERERREDRDVRAEGSSHASRAVVCRGAAAIGTKPKAKSSARGEQPRLPKRRAR